MPISGAPEVALGGCPESLGHGRGWEPRCEPALPTACCCSESRGRPFLGRIWTPCGPCGLSFCKAGLALAPGEPTRSGLG